MHTIFSGAFEVGEIFLASEFIDLNQLLLETMNYFHYSQILPDFCFERAILKVGKILESNIRKFESDFRS